MTTSRRAEAITLGVRFLAGAALSAMAWLHVGNLALLILFPVGLAMATRRREAFAFVFGYFSFNSAEIPSIMLRFFDGEWVALAVLAPIVLTVTLSAPFLLTGKGSALKRSAGALLAFLLITLPGIGFVGWLNPLFAAAMLYPSLGAIGIGLCIITFSFIAGQNITTRRGAGLLLLSLAPALFINVWAVAQLKERPAIFGVYAINTDLGKPSGTPEYREIVTAEIARRVEAHTGEGFDLVIFPESILHDVSAVDEVMLMPVTSAKGRPDVWVGATSRRSDGLFDNAIIALDAGLPAVGFSRLPVPIGNWRPLVGGGVYPRPFESDIVEWRGHMIALSVCYEDGVLWGHPGLLSGQADLLVSVANLWALEGTRTAHAQSVGAGALARLGGVSMRRAVNE